jgi:hypothetical protein
MQPLQEQRSKEKVAAAELFGLPENKRSMPDKPPILLRTVF